MSVNAQFLGWEPRQYVSRPNLGNARMPALRIQPYATLCMFLHIGFKFSSK